MEHHVWAVWDFMSLLKALQNRFTCTQIPWRPIGDGKLRRFVNEIVMLEECDTSSRGVMSHFELYRAAMGELGADTAPIDRALAGLGDGLPAKQVLARSGAPEEALDFSRNSLAIASDGSDATLVGVFTFSREELIPDLFRSVVGGLARSGARTQLLTEYLERHISVDEVQHGPLARRLVEGVCGESPELWGEASAAAESALCARIRLWDAVLARLRGEQVGR
jgi:hypothetical protein